MTPNTSETTVGSTFDHELARIAAGAYDDAQDVRRSMMNRVRDVVRKRNEDIPFDVVEEEKDDRSYDEKYADDNLPDLIEEMREEGTLTSHEFNYLREMLEAATTAAHVEDRYETIMGLVQSEPLYQNWLDHVTGVGPITTAKLVHRIGYCEDFDRVSQLWSYAGLDPGSKRERGEKLDHDPDLKSLTTYLVATNLIRQGERSRYRTEFYDPYKQTQIDRMERAEDMTEAELESVKWTPPESKGHAENRARRYLAKKFLKHYWAIARDIRGLDVPDEWVITHGGHEKREDTFENPFYARRELRSPTA